MKNLPYRVRLSSPRQKEQIERESDEQQVKNCSETEFWYGHIFRHYRFLCLGSKWRKVLKQQKEPKQALLHLGYRGQAPASQKSQRALQE